MVQQAVQAGHAAVEDALDAIAEGLGDERRLFGDGMVGRAGGRDHDEPDPLARLGPHDHESRLSVVDVRQPGRGYRVGDDLLGTRREDVGVSLGEPREDRDDLRRRLARAEHCLGSAAAQCAVMIHLGEVEVLVG